MTNLGPLTTTYTPSGTGCQSVHIGSTLDYTWLQLGTTSDCFRSSYQPFKDDYFSPGVCIQSYSLACTVSVGSSVTAATCCPSGYNCRTSVTSDDANLCLSAMTSDSYYVADVLTYVSRVPTKIGTTTALHEKGEVVYAKGVAVWKGEDDNVEWPIMVADTTSTTANMSTTTDTSSTATRTSTPATSASMPIETSAVPVSASDESNSQSTTSISHNAKIGIGLGISFGVLLFLGSVLGAYRLGVRKGSRIQQGSTLDSGVKGMGQGMMMPVHELNEQRRTLEMSAQKEPTELDGTMKHGR
ncbi:hypothetical protein M426DRAFT_251140 [Hypoxylon sp. CI-4A]|nr:hypothetical protein M426DRAFT_251140 [Hypoxylon sp. CI-4A]